MNWLRYFIYLLLLNEFLLYQPLCAQDTTKQVTRSALIKTNVAGPFSVLLEIPVVPLRSVQLSVQSSKSSLFSITRYFSLTADYRFYVGKVTPTARRPAPNGLYWGPYLKYRTVANEHTGNTYATLYSTTTYSMIGGGAVIGSQFINRWGLSIDAFMGLGYFPIISHQTTIDISTPYPPQPKPKDYQLDIRPGICIGLAF